MDIVFIDDFSASAWPINSGNLVIVAKTTRAQIELLHVQIIEVKGRIQPFLRNQIAVSKSLVSLDAVVLRANLSSVWGAFFTRHVLMVHSHLDSKVKDVVADTAWRYSTLTAWGESSAARELALELGVPVRTVQNRLRIAREKGILSSPGPGSRLGR